MRPLATCAEEARRLWPVANILVGFFLGCGTMWWLQAFLTPERLRSKWLTQVGGRTEALVFLAMAVHSIPEGLAVGDKIATGKVLGTPTIFLDDVVHLGPYDSATLIEALS